MIKENEFMNIDLFRDIRKEDMPSLLFCLGGFKKVFDKGEYIIFDGSFLRHIGVVLSGTVHMVKEDYWGSKSILSVLHQSDVFGESVVCGSFKDSMVAFQAIEKTEILFLAFDKVMHTCGHECLFHRQLVENMVAVIAHKNVELMNKMEILSKKTIRERVITFLSQKSTTSKSAYISIEMGRLDLADYLCVDRSALTRELNKMRTLNIIDYDKNTFILK